MDQDGLSTVCCRELEDKAEYVHPIVAQGLDMLLNMNIVVHCVRKLDAWLAERS